MPEQNLTPRELNNVYKTRDALISYIDEMRQSNTTDKYLLEAQKHIEKAMDILEEVSDSHTCVLYGPPEVVFSPKELAEMRLRDEIAQQVENTELTAEQWREIVSELVSSEGCDCGIVQDLIEEAFRKSKQ